MHRSRVDAFRHRAAAIIADPIAASHVYRSLTLIGPAVIASQRSAPTGRANARPMTGSAPPDDSEAIQKPRTQDGIASSQELLAMTIWSKCVAGHECHPPWIMADVLVRARRRKPGRREFGNHLGFAIALQPDAGAQLPVV